MEQFQGLPRNLEIDPLEAETYAVLERSMLDEIMTTHREQTANDGSLLAAEYMRSDPFDDAERIGIVINCVPNLVRNMEPTYYVSVHHYTELVAATQSDDPTALFISVTYKIEETRAGLSCLSDARYIDCFVAKHLMSVSEHDDLMDELVALRSWQETAQHEHDIAK